MNISVRRRDAEHARWYVHSHWWRIALPFAISLSTSYFPGEHATTDVTDGSWGKQNAINISVLMFTLRVVVRGPLFTREEAEG